VNHQLGGKGIPISPIAKWPLQVQLFPWHGGTGCFPYQLRTELENSLLIHPEPISPKQSRLVDKAMQDLGLMEWAQWTTLSSIPPRMHSYLTELPPLMSFFHKGGFNIQTCTTFVCPTPGGPGSPPPAPMLIQHHTGKFGLAT
jgi:hypothetical protein